MAEKKTSEINELSERVLDGVRKAVRQLIETNAVNNVDMVVGDQEGNIKTVSARDLLQKLRNQA